MIFRRQPPTSAPVPWAALRDGVRALTTPSDRRSERVGEMLQGYYGSRNVLLTRSGTAALSLAMLGARRLSGGAPIAVPAYACYDVATAAVGSGSPVVFYDLDPATLAPDPNSLTAAIAAGVSAVVIVHPYGIPIDIDSLAPVMGGTLTIEDAAQGAGASLHERPLGSMGALGVLSFGRGKGVTSGRGGALLANDDTGQAILDDVELPLSGPAGWSDAAIAAALAWLSHPRIFWALALLPFLHLGETVYKSPVPPRPISRAGAAILSHTWWLAEEEATVRRANASRLERALQSGGVLEAFAAPTGASPGYLRLPALAPDPAGRAERVTSGEHLGIAPGYPRPLSTLEPLAGQCENAEGGFPGAWDLCERLLTIPTHGLLDESDLTRLERWIVGEEWRHA